MGGGVLECAQFKLFTAKNGILSEYFPLPYSRFYCAMGSIKMPSVWNTHGNKCGRERQAERARHIRTSIWIYRRKTFRCIVCMQMFLAGKLGNLCSTAPFPYKSSIIYIIMHNWNWFRGPNGYSLARLDGQSVDAVAISSRNVLGAKMKIIRWDARIQFPADTHTHEGPLPPPHCGDRWQPDWVKKQLAAERETC